MSGPTDPDPTREHPAPCGCRARSGALCAYRGDHRPDWSDARDTPCACACHPVEPPDGYGHPNALLGAAP